MRLFSVIGVSSSGKTTTIEALIRELRGRGYSVGSVKEIHFQDFAMDLPGSNTHRHRLAGAARVTARGFHETDLLYQGKLSMDEILLHYDFDFVALEGVSDMAAPFIITAHTEQEVRERLGPLCFAVAGRVAEGREQVAGLPALSALTRAKELADLVEQRAGEYVPPHQYLLNGRPLSARQNSLLAAALGRIDGSLELREVKK